MSRGAQNLTTDQAALLKQSKDAYATLRTAQAEIDQKVALYREELERELEAIRVRFVQSVYAANTGGVPVTRIARDALGHQGTTATYDAIKEGSRYAAPVAEAETLKAPSVFERAADGSIVFTPTATDVAPILAKLGFEPDAVPSDASATFTVTDGLISSTTPSILPSGTMNPIVAMVMADGSKHARALVEFAEAAA